MPDPNPRTITVGELLDGWHVRPQFLAVAGVVMSAIAVFDPWSSAGLGMAAGGAFIACGLVRAAELRLVRESAAGVSSAPVAPVAPAPAPLRTTPAPAPSKRATTAPPDPIDLEPSPGGLGASTEPPPPAPSTGRPSEPAQAQETPPYDATPHGPATDESHPVP